MVKHINQVLAAEYKHSLEYQLEQQQIETERCILHMQERTLQTSQQTAVIVKNINTGDNDMNLKQAAVAAFTAASLATTTVGVAGCSEEELVTRQSADKVFLNGDGFDITKNPNAKQAYKLKVKVKDAPGKFQITQGDVTFGIKNIKDCGYIVDALQETATQVRRSIDFPLTQTSEAGYEGIFYTDWGKDGDFFGKGVCHWSFESVGAALSATGTTGEAVFGHAFDFNGTKDDRFMLNTPLTRFYLKDNYPISQFWNSGTAKNELHKLSPELQNRLFSIIITVEEVK